MPFDQVRKIIERELKNPIGEIFASVETTPLGTASIAQVQDIAVIM